MAVRDYATRKIAMGWTAADVCKVLGISQGQLTEALEYKSDEEKSVFKQQEEVQTSIFAEDIDVSPF
jgi:prophage antirepressor-like protein